MTLLMPTCERVTSLLTAYEEGALGPFDWLRLKLHLGLCPPCRAFLEGFARTPALVRQLLDDGSETCAERALAGALTAVRLGLFPRGPQLHPEPEAWAALASGKEACLALLLRVHLGHCAECRAAQGAEQAIAPEGEPLPTALAPLLPPEAHWRWQRWGLGGGSAARLFTDPATGSSLNLACLPGGCRTPQHGHRGLEHVLILSGALQDGPAHLRAGDWISHGPGHQHGPTADADEACWALIALDQPVRFAGWRRVFS